MTSLPGLHFPHGFADQLKMSARRIFAFNFAKDRAGPEQPDDLIRRLADQIFKDPRDLPESAAWGVSPAERYLLQRHQDRRD
jgi:hypothetical protein